MSPNHWTARKLPVEQIVKHHKSSPLNFSLNMSIMDLRICMWEFPDNVCAFVPHTTLEEPLLYASHGINPSDRTQIMVHPL